MVGRDKCKKNEISFLFSSLNRNMVGGEKCKQKPNKSHFSFPLEQFMLKAGRKQKQERQDQFLKSWCGQVWWLLNPLKTFTFKKSTKRDGGPCLYCTLSTLFILFTVFTLFTLFTLFDTVYNALYRSYCLHCLHLSKCFTWCLYII